MPSLTPMPGRRWLLPFVAAPLLIAVAIGLGGGAGSSTGGAGDGSQAGAGAVSIKGFAFDPEPIEVAVGETVTWTNLDGAAHSIQDVEGAFETSPDMATDDTFEATYDAPGEHPYICGIHQYMRGTVVVR